MAKEKKKRPKQVSGVTYEVLTGCGDLYVTINEDNSGYIEVLLTMGKGGGCASSQAESLGRMITVAFKHDATPETVIKQLSGISCHQGKSCADATSVALSEHFKVKPITAK